MNQRFDTQDRRINGLETEMLQRFDAQDEGLDDLAKDVSDLGKLSERVFPSWRSDRHHQAAIANRRRTLALNPT